MVQLFITDCLLCRVVNSRRDFSLLAETWQLAAGSSLWLELDLPARQPVETCIHFHSNHGWGHELLEDLPLEATHAVRLVFETPNTKNESETDLL